MVHSSHKIVLLDPDRILLELLREALSEKGFQIETFNTGRELLDYLEKKNDEAISLFLIEQLLPDMNGILLIDTLLKKRPTTPIFVLSSLTNEDDILPALKHGALDYITKPFYISILIQKIVGMLNFINKQSTLSQGIK